MQKVNPNRQAVELFNMVNLAAAGLRLRGKVVEDEWQVHRVGCRDGQEIKRFLRAVRGEDAVEMGTIPDLRAAFEAENGPPFDTGWEWDQHVAVMPCVGRGR